MSINFPTDPPPQRRKGGSGFIFLLIFGAIAFMVFRGMGEGPQPEAPPNRSIPDSNRSVAEDDRYRIDPNFGKNETAAPRRTNSSDWGMEDGPTKRNAASAPSTTDQKTVKKKNADWGMEDGPVQSNQSSNNGFQFSDSNDFEVPAGKTNKKTTKGDWGLEEVETK